MKRLSVLALALTFLAGTFALSTPTLAAAPACPELTAGDIYRVPNSKETYYLNELDERMVFLNEDTLASWLINDAEIIDAPAHCYDAHEPAGVVTYKPGSRLIKLPDTAEIYALTKVNQLAWLNDAALLEELYGPSWENLLVTLSPLEKVFYEITGEKITTETAGGYLDVLEQNGFSIESQEHTLRAVRAGKEMVKRAFKKEHCGSVVHKGSFVLEDPTHLQELFIAEFQGTTSYKSCDTLAQALDVDIVIDAGYTSEAMNINLVDDGKGTTYVKLDADFEDGAPASPLVGQWIAMNESATVPLGTPVPADNTLLTNDHLDELLGQIEPLSITEVIDDGDDHHYAFELQPHRTSKFVEAIAGGNEGLVPVERDHLRREVKSGLDKMTLHRGEIWIDEERELPTKLLLDIEVDHDEVGHIYYEHEFAYADEATFISTPVDAIPLEELILQELGELHPDAVDPTAHAQVPEVSFSNSRQQ